MKQMPALLLRAALGRPASSATRRTSALRMSPSGNKTSAQASHQILRTPRKQGLLFLQSLVAEELLHAPPFDGEAIEVIRYSVSIKMTVGGHL